MPSLHFVVPGKLQTLTGGFVYDRRMVQILRERHWQTTVHELEGAFPFPGPSQLAQVARVFHGIPTGSLVLVDGLAFGVLPDLMRAHATRLRLVALVHHPLARETGLTTEQAERFAASEKLALACANSVIATSAATAASLSDYDVSPERIWVVTPGTDTACLATGSPTACTELLCVATLTPRKGHAILFDALARLRDHEWHLRCIGSLTRDPQTTRALEAQLDRLGLLNRISLVGEVDEATLAAHYRAADLFVLASRFEGYGMVFDEALARGLPIIATGTGAVRSTVPMKAGLVASQGGVDELTGLLYRWFSEPLLRQRLRAGAASARLERRSWTIAGQELAAALTAKSR